MLRLKQPVMECRSNIQTQQYPKHSATLFTALLLSLRQSMSNSTTFERGFVLERLWKYISRQLNVKLTPCVSRLELRSSEQTDTCSHTQTLPPSKPGALFKQKKLGWMLINKTFKQTLNRLGSEKSHLEAQVLVCDQPQHLSFVWLRSPPAEAQMVCGHTAPHWREPC